MSVIGQQIKKYRLAKEITQEQLGRLIGVTTQAVSKWECGSTPDAEILPALAEALGVSIDTLFGREKRNVAHFLADKLCRVSEQEAFCDAFNMMWALEIGLINNIVQDEYFVSQFVDSPTPVDGKKDYFTKIVQNSGISTVRLSPDLKYCFLMVEPQASMREQLADRESLRQVFEVFADKTLLDILFLMYSRQNTPITASFIGKHIGLSNDEVERCMEKLCQNHLATCEAIVTADGEIHTYMFHQESSVIPLLCFADEIAKPDFVDLSAVFTRTKPLMP